MRSWLCLPDWAQPPTPGCCGRFPALSCNRWRSSQRLGQPQDQRLGSLPTGKEQLAAWQSGDWALSGCRWSLALGAVGSLVGAMITLSAGDWGYVFALVIVAALVALAVLLGNSVILGIAAIGPLQVLPATVMHFFPLCAYGAAGAARRRTGAVGRGVVLNTT
jgi:hypothetical protein